MGKGFSAMSSLNRCCSTADGPSLDAVKNGRQTKKVEGNVKTIVRDRCAPDSTAICRDIIFLRRDIQRRKIGIVQARSDLRRHVVHHRMVSEIGERVTLQRRYGSRAQRASRSPRPLSGTSTAALC
jgi:hypothetical protein